ncbi:hypothetical protein [Pseudoxanthomonas winnipegensis]|uniref:Uncharacterized protein n=1 Tax=Pseudoxanthomonas winnipegensis TaxID=2480810 RepID=A0A4Q8L517_9GAMM|nr:hypothetical protein [Pseudoxanthomonas winnipegensis]TAA20338.1 hypothetical protein EA660_18285 [Pseudoxanthomonas winnipegensis]
MKCKLKITATREYWADSEHYDDARSAEQMAALDASSDPWMILDHPDTAISIVPVEERSRDEG